MHTYIYMCVCIYIYIYIYTRVHYAHMRICLACLSFCIHVCGVFVFVWCAPAFLLQKKNFDFKKSSCACAYAYQQKRHCLPVSMHERVRLHAHMIPLYLVNSMLLPGGTHGNRASICLVTLSRAVSP